jgi:hypothetical protein
MATCLRVSLKNVVFFVVKISREIVEASLFTSEQDNQGASRSALRPAHVFIKISWLDQSRSDRAECIDLGPMLSG